MFGRFRRFLTETENVNIILFLVGAGLIVSLGVPQVVPSLDRGAICTNLPHPRGGNNQSLLALSGNDHQDMELELDLLHEAENERGDVLIPNGETLVLRLTFDNKDIGPVMLYINPNQYRIQFYDEFEAANGLGVNFEIRPVSADTPRRQAGVPEVATGVFDLDDLYLLPATSQCYVEYRISTDVLAQLQPSVAVGEWRIRAYYRNSQRGVLIEPTPQGSQSTPTPMFDDQGVWTGSVRSNEVIFEIR